MGVTDWLQGLAALATWLFPAVIILGFWGAVIWRRVRRRLRDMRQHEAAGTIGPASFFQGANMPIHYDFVAHIGTGGAADLSAGEKVLRPSIGVRLVVLIVAGMILYYALTPGFWPTEFSETDRSTEWIFKAAQVLLPIAAAYAVLYVFTSEARYDRDVLILTRLMQRREYRWRALTRIGDGGAYDLVLTFKPGGKAKVLKHSAGIRDFKAFALAQVQRNRSAHA